MPKAFFIPADDQGKCLWLSNFAAKLPTYAPTIGVDPTEVTDTQADFLVFNYVCDANNQFKQFGLDWTAYKNGLRSGPTVGPMPVPPPSPRRHPQCRRTFLVALLRWARASR